MMYCGHQLQYSGCLYCHPGRKGHLTNRLNWCRMTLMETKRQISIAWPPSQLEWLHKQAKKRGVSLAEYLRALVGEAMEREGQK